MTKEGLRAKVNRLPDDIKEELNKRLKVYYGADAVLEWLHTQPTVTEFLKTGVIKGRFNAQNLSAWRQSKPYRAWLDRHNSESMQKEMCALARRVDMLETTVKLLAREETKRE